MTVAQSFVWHHKKMLTGEHHGSSWWHYKKIIFAEDYRPEDTRLFLAARSEYGFILFKSQKILNLNTAPMDANPIFVLISKWYWRLLMKESEKKQRNSVANFPSGSESRLLLEKYFQAPSRSAGPINSGSDPDPHQRGEHSSSCNCYTHCSHWGNRSSFHLIRLSAARPGKIC